MAGKLRVLQFSYGESLYGAERWILTLIKYLDPELIETVVAAIRDEDTERLPLVEAASEQGFETVVIDGRRHLLRSSSRPPVPRRPLDRLRDRPTSTNTSPAARCASTTTTPARPTRSTSRSIASGWRGGGPGAARG